MLFLHIKPYNARFWDSQIVSVCEFVCVCACAGTSVVRNCGRWSFSSVIYIYCDTHHFWATIYPFVLWQPEKAGWFKCRWHFLYRIRQHEIYTPLNIRFEQPTKWHGNLFYILSWPRPAPMYHFRGITVQSTAGQIDLRIDALAIKDICANGLVRESEWKIGQMLYRMRKMPLFCLHCTHRHTFSNMNYNVIFAKWIARPTLQRRYP